MSVVHFGLAWALVAATTLLLVAGLATAAGMLRSRLWLDRSILVQLAIALPAALTGIALLVDEHHVPEPLHVVYGAVLVGGPVTVRYFARNAATRRLGGAMTVAALILAGVVVRSFMTGS